MYEQHDDSLPFMDAILATPSHMMLGLSSCLIWGVNSCADMLSIQFECTSFVSLLVHPYNKHVIEPMIRDDLKSIFPPTSISNNSNASGHAAATQRHTGPVVFLPLWAYRGCHCVRGTADDSYPTVRVYLIQFSAVCRNLQNSSALIYVTPRITDKKTGEISRLLEMFTAYVDTIPVIVVNSVLPVVEKEEEMFQLFELRRSGPATETPTLAAREHVRFCLYMRPPIRVINIEPLSKNILKSLTARLHTLSNQGGGGRVMTLLIDHILCEETPAVLQCLFDYWDRNCQEYTINLATPYLTNSQLYRKVFSERIMKNMAVQPANKSNDLQYGTVDIIEKKLLGAVKPDTHFGCFMLDYCIKVLRPLLINFAEFGDIIDLGRLVVVNVQQMERLNSDEIDEVVEVFRSFLHEVKMISPYWYNEAKSKSFALILLCAWDSYHNGPVPAAIRSLFTPLSSPTDSSQTALLQTTTELESWRLSRYKSDLGLVCYERGVLYCQQGHVDSWGYSISQGIPLLKFLPPSINVDMMKRVHNIGQLLYKEDSLCLAPFPSSLARKMLTDLDKVLSRNDKCIAASSAPHYDGGAQPGGFILSNTQKAALKELSFCVFSAIKNASVFANAGVSPRPRAILYGVAGTGKTSIVELLCHTFSTIPVKTVNLQSLYSPYLGETEQNLRREFENLEKIIPAVLVLEGLEYLACSNNKWEDFSTSSDSDEFSLGDGDDDAFGKQALRRNKTTMPLGGQRDESHRRLLTTLLLCLDAVDSKSEELLSRMGIIGISRINPNQLEQAIVRPGRLDHWIGIG